MKGINIGRFKFALLIAFFYGGAAAADTRAISLFDFKEKSNLIPLDFREGIAFSYFGFSSFSDDIAYRVSSFDRILGLVGVSAGIFSREIEGNFNRFVQNLDIKVFTIGNTLKTTYMNRYEKMDKLFLYAASFSPRTLVFPREDIVIGFSPEVAFTSSLFLIYHSYSLFGLHRVDAKDFSVFLSPEFTLNFDRSSSNRNIDQIFRTSNSLSLSFLISAEPVPYFPDFLKFIKTAFGVRFSVKYYTEGKIAAGFSPTLKLSPINWLVLNLGSDLYLRSDGFGMNYPTPYLVYFGVHVIGGIKKGVDLIKISGRVVDENDNPIDEAVVYEVDGYGAISSGGGFFTIRVPEGKDSIRLIVSKEGFKPQEYISSAMYDQQIVIKLQKKNISTKVSGVILDEEGEALQGDVIVYETKQKFSTNQKGEFEFEITPGRYSLLFSSEKFYTRQVDIDINKGQDVKVVVALNRIKGGISVVEVSDGKETYYNIPKIKFDRVTGRLYKESYGSLDLFSDYLKMRPDLKVSIEVYVDRTANQNLDELVTETTAEEIKGYLILKGISPERLIVEGKGSESQVAPNDSPENREKNRRVVVKKLSEGEAGNGLFPKTEENIQEHQRKNTEKMGNERNLEQIGPDQGKREIKDESQEQKKSSDIPGESQNNSEGNSMENKENSEQNKGGEDKK